MITWKPLNNQGAQEDAGGRRRRFFKRIPQETAFSSEHGALIKKKAMRQAHGFKKLSFPLGENSVYLFGVGFGDGEYPAFDAELFALLRDVSGIDAEEAADGIDFVGFEGASVSPLRSRSWSF